MSQRGPATSRPACFARSAVGAAAAVSCGWLMAQTAPVVATAADTTVAQWAPSPQTTPGAAPTSGQASTDSGQLLPLDVRVNGTAAGNWVFLERSDGLYAMQDAFDSWRLIRRGGVAGINVRGQEWFSLSSVPGFQSKINFAEQSIELDFTASAFAATRLVNERVAQAKPSPVVPAAFLNYDVSYSQSKQNGATGSQDLGALLEAGFSSEFGVFSHSQVGRNLTSSSSQGGAPQAGPNWVRLESSFTKNWPESQTTLRVGDSSTRTSASGRSVYFGGVQFGRNFLLTPGFVTQPVPVIRGSATSPSTVELYVNDALRQTSSVPSGPFAVDNFPVLTSGGNVRIVVRDLLGRETVLIQPFANYGSLLAAGLSDWSAEVGALRNDLGFSSNEYGRRFAAGMMRYGVSADATLEAGAQFSSLSRHVNAGLAVALPGQILGVVGLATSQHQTAGRGAQLNLSLQYEGFRQSIAGKLVTANDNFREFGISSLSLPSKREFSANYTLRTANNAGSFGAGFASITSHAGSRLDTASLNYSQRLTKEGASIRFSITAVHGNNSTFSNATSVGVTLLIPLDKRVTSSSALNLRRGSNEAYTSVSATPEGEFGTGWRALAGTRQSSGYGEAGVYLRTPQLDLMADISAATSSQNLRLGLQSALVVIDGDVFVSRRVRDGFAVVELLGYPDVNVKYNSADAGRTNAQGKVFIPRMQPYVLNNVRIDPNELPIGAEIENIEQSAVPSAKSGVKISFPVRTGRAALVKIILPNGQEPPAGADVKLVGDNREFFVARRGEAFITGLQATNRVQVTWANGSCEFDLPLSSDLPASDVVRLGPVICVENKK